MDRDLYGQNEMMNEILGTYRIKSYDKEIKLKCCILIPSNENTIAQM